MRLILTRSSRELFAAVACLACGASAERTDAVSTADVHRFIDAWHQLAPADSTCPSFDEYFRLASEGLRAYASKFGVGRRELCAAVRRKPERYAAIEPKLVALDSAGDRIDSLFERFKVLVPNAKVRPVFFVVGNGISGGTTTHGLHPVVLVGVELMGRPQGIPHTVAHEFVHTLQDYPWIGMLQAGPSFLRGSLLRNSIMEGSATFIADVVTGGHEQNEWAEAHEAELWTDFQRELHGKDYSRWLYNGPRGDRPANLGYWMGYRITESYYARAADKNRAVFEILHIKDFDRFLRESGYAGVSHSRPTIPAAIAPAIALLDSVLSRGDREALRRLLPDSAPKLQLSLGLWLRNNAGLWKKGPVADSLLARGMTHPDDMSNLLLQAYGLYLQGRPINLDSMIRAVPKPPTGFKVLTPPKRPPGFLSEW